jgi:hypothetical protein
MVTPEIAVEVQTILKTILKTIEGKKAGPPKKKPVPKSRFPDFSVNIANLYKLLDSLYAHIHARMYMYLMYRYF